ncbi:hypothetical protein OOK41_16615 [Micromonospora sp. NBC_01655]|uniref:phosphotriesterase family protein n=1 Tax=Micromonospora sp. NBC_01655 TaxID=2975983 RepID=UPI00224EF283|nr:hypothetical protein [Micromonospora sp. NBC_01655]MCX4471912.1 hypothetical protein [Micromonospora sp. NBC_01655]
MESVHTVLGPRAPEEFTQVLPHEHLLCDFSPVTGQGPHVLNDLELIIPEVLELPDVTRTCLVEVTPADVGRNPAGLRAISERTGLWVVMGTGWYRESYHPQEIDRLSVNEIADRMVEELTTGVPVTGPAVQAGIIGEIGSDRDYVSAAEERVLRAAARASNRTGAAVTTHAFMYPVGLPQLAVMLEERADPSRIVIGHADTYMNPDYHRELLKRGVYVEFDTCGRTHLNPDARRADALVALIRAGWLEQLLISSDRCFRSDLKAFGGVGYPWALTGFVALLKDRGVSADEIDVLTRVNPLRMLAW